MESETFEEVKLEQITLSVDDIITNVITNVIKMINNRGLLDNMNSTLDRLLNEDRTRLEYEITDNINLKIIRAKLSSLSKSNDIRNYLNNNSRKKNILVFMKVENTSSKDKLLREYIDCEIFEESDFLMDKASHWFVPHHEIFNGNKEELYEEYNLSDETISKILTTDPMVRYYNAKEGDIMRIIRSSDESGLSIIYRLVVKPSK